MNPVAERVVDALGDAFVDLAGDALPLVVDALTDPYMDVEARITPTARGWSSVFDLDQTPDPVWLGQVTGSKVPAGMTTEDARAYVRTNPYWRRGTPAAIIAAVQLLLTGDRRVTLLERDGSPWRLTIRVYRSEVPGGVSVEDIRNAAAAQKPVGIVLSVEIVAGATYAHMKAVHGTYTDFAADFPTYDAARNHLPEGGTTP